MKGVGRRVKGEGCKVFDSDGVHYIRAAWVKLMYSPNPTPYTLKERVREGGSVWETDSTPYTIHLTPSTIHLTPDTLHCALYNLRPAPYTLCHTPCTMHPTPCIMHTTPYTLHPTPYTMHPTP